MVFSMEQQSAQQVLEALQYAMEGVEYEISQLPENDSMREQFGEQLERTGKLYEILAAQLEKEQKRSEREQYERFRLQWMLDHGHTLEELISELEQYRKGPDAAENLHTLFEDWDFDRGFDGELWPCWSEWKENDKEQIMSVGNSDMEPIMLAIEVKGGLVQNVYANGPADVEVYDLDYSECAGEDEIEECDERAESLSKIAADPTFHRAW